MYTRRGVSLGEQEGAGIIVARDAQFVNRVYKTGVLLVVIIDRLWMSRLG